MGANIAALDRNLEAEKVAIASPQVAGAVNEFTSETAVQVKGGIDAEKHVKSLLNVGDRLKKANKDSLALAVRVQRTAEGAAGIGALRAKRNADLLKTVATVTKEAAGKVLEAKKLGPY